MTMDLGPLEIETIEHLKSYAGLSQAQAKTLVEALCDAAQAEVLTMVSGSEPYPTSMSDLRALRLRYICQASERLLSPREVAILFRTTDSAVQTLLTRMERLYPAAVEHYLDELVKAGYWKPKGAAGKVRVVLEFRQLGAWEHALAKLDRAGVTDMQPNRTALTIETPKVLPQGGEVTDLLGNTPNKREAEK